MATPKASEKNPKTLARTSASKSFGLDVASGEVERVVEESPPKTSGISLPPQQDGKKRTKKEMIKLNSAVFRGDLQEVLAMISEGYDFTGEIDDKNQTVLHIGAYAGQIQLIEYFLNTGKVEINAVDKHGWTALLCAASCGHLKVCSLLLRRGADAKIFNDQNTTALHYLVRKNYGETDPKKRKSGKPSEAESEYFAVLQLLLDKGIDINTKNYIGETPLMQACARGNDAAVQFLLEHKAKYQLTNGKGVSTLFYAENSGSDAVVQLLNAKIAKDAKKELVTHKDIKLENYPEVVNLMKDPENGVQLKDRKLLFITHHKSVTGMEIVDWLLKNLAIRSREDAVNYCQKLVEASWLYSVDKKTKFKDSKAIYKFTSSGELPAEEEVPKIEKVGIEDFDTLKVIGKGGFGKVVLARKKDNGKIYAIKIMEKARILNKPRDFKNLMSEKKILQNDCSFLVHLNYAFQTETDFYLVMDFMAGGDLHYHWKQQKRFPEKVVQFIAAELVLALSYLHSCGIIYRDLKPQNVLLDASGHVCLADFGLSKEVLTTDTALHTACGTPTYSAPEVLDGSPYSKSVDYWSLGIVLYQLLIGKPPFEFNGDFAKLLHAIYSQKILYPQEIVSENAVLLLEGLLARDPLKRLDDPDIIKRHPFFKGVDWEKLEVKNVRSPIKIAGSEELKHFDPRFTRMSLDDDKVKESREIVEGFSVVFEDF